MDIFVYFKSTSQAMLQIFLLGAVGYFLVKRKALSSQGLTGLTHFTIDVAFPALIFWQIISQFSFKVYPYWWVFTLFSIIITAVGFAVGGVFGHSIKEKQVRREFKSLLAYQNAGYLPLTLLGWIVPQGQLSMVLIYLFLFLLGFNLVFWSWGVYYLSSNKARSFSLKSLLSSPVVATLLGFLFLFLGIEKSLPPWVSSPLEMVGNCSFPLAIIVIGASLADLSVGKTLKMGLLARLVVLKLILMPLLAIAFLAYVRLPYLVGLLLVLELAVPSATNLTLVARRYSVKDTLISQGVFVTHLASLITIPLFLALFNWVVFRN